MSAEGGVEVEAEGIMRAKVRRFYSAEFVVLYCGCEFGVVVYGSRGAFL